MSKHYNLISLSLLSTACALLWNSAFSQEANETTLETAQSEPAQEYGRSRLYFFDRPMQVQSEFDDRIEFPLAGPTIASEDDPAFKRRMETIRNYDSSVAGIESNGGAWNVALAEELSSLGELHQLQGDHIQAIETFDRAVHVSRINNGLHTLDQIPAIEQMIESYLALNNWEQADLYYNYLFYIQQKSYGVNDPRMISIIDRLATWNLRAFNIGYGESLGLRLSTAQILFNAAANLVGVHFGKSDERFARYQRKIANSAYLVTEHPDLMRELNTTEFRLAQDDWLNRLASQDRSSSQGFQAGENALLEIANFRRTQPENIEALAEAITHLADWYLLFEQRRAAADLYNEAWQVLSEAENSEELLASFFAQVTPLPSFLAEPTSLVFSRSSIKDTTELNVGYADLSFDVTENGIVRNVDVVSGATEDNAAILSRLRREVRNSRFRPVIRDGVARRINGNQFRYRYWY